MTRPGGRLAVRMMAAQIVVITVGGLVLAATAVAVAPGLFSRHLHRAGEHSPAVQDHSRQAFDTAFGISLSVGLLAALIAAAAVSWLLVRRVARPVEHLADAVEEVAAGRFDIEVPAADFSSELARLSHAVDTMARRLGETEASRRRLLADLAHELRTPVATLDALLEALEDDVVPADEHAWTTMREQTRRITRLLTDLRELARAEEQGLDLRLDDLDVTVVAAAAVRAAAPRFAARGVHLAHHDPDTELHVNGDADRLGQVLANLLDNALRHTPPGGHVELDVRGEGREVVLEVVDDGEGIPAGHLETVFERFHREDPARSTSEGSGSGLGLTIARAIASGHRGSLTAHHRGDGPGTRMRLVLPRRG